jgi:hypothetical protein
MPLPRALARLGAPHCKGDFRIGRGPVRWTYWRAAGSGRGTPPEPSTSSRVGPVDRKTPVLRAPRLKPGAGFLAAHWPWFPVGIPHRFKSFRRGWADDRCADGRSDGALISALILFH